MFAARIPGSQTGEHLYRPLARGHAPQQGRNIQRGLDSESQFPTVALLRCCNRALDIVKELPRKCPAQRPAGGKQVTQVAIGHSLPTSRGATATKATTKTAAEASPAATAAKSAAAKTTTKTAAVGPRPRPAAAEQTNEEPDYPCQQCGAQDTHQQPGNAA